MMWIDDGVNEMVRRDGPAAHQVLLFKATIDADAFQGRNQGVDPSVAAERQQQGLIVDRTPVDIGHATNGVRGTATRDALVVNRDDRRGSFRTDDLIEE